MCLVAIPICCAWCDCNCIFYVAEIFVEYLFIIDVADKIHRFVVVVQLTDVARFIHVVFHKATLTSFAGWRKFHRHAFVLLEHSFKLFHDFLCFGLDIAIPGETNHRGRFRFWRVSCQNGILSATFVSHFKNAS